MKAYEVIWYSDDGLYRVICTQGEELMLGEARGDDGSWKSCEGALSMALRHLSQRIWREALDRRVASMERFLGKPGEKKRS